MILADRIELYLSVLEALIPERHLMDGVELLLERDAHSGWWRVSQ